MRREHITQAHDSGWGCSCGTGRVLSFVGVARARAAANQHLRAVYRKAAAGDGHARAAGLAQTIT